MATISGFPPEVMEQSYAGSTLFLGGAQSDYIRPEHHAPIYRLFPNAEARERIADRPFFQDFLRRLFHQRRKFARSVLCGMYRKQISKPEVDAVLAELEIKPESRAEQLDVPTLVELSNRIRVAIG